VGRIVVNLDVVLASRRMTLTELSERVGVTMANLSILKNGKAKAVRFTTLEAICRELDCQPGDLIKYEPGDGAGDA
jgi:putative transcriptional regulator